jgi:hypothetical protein
MVGDSNSCSVSQDSSEFEAGRDKTYVRDLAKAKLKLEEW